MRRDRLTFGMMVGIPLMQLVLFGFAINADPKQLPTAVLVADHGPQGRTLLHAIRNSGYFDFVRQVSSETEAQRALASGEVLFVVTIPESFTRDLLRGDRPVLLVEADATDPAATSNAIGSLQTLLASALDRDLKGPLSDLSASSGPVDLRIHALYNPERITQYNIVPGLMGIVLTLTMTLITGLAITRERERGTPRHIPIVALTAHAMKGDAERCLAAGMDAYLAKPLQPAELVAVMSKLVPDSMIDAARLLERVGGDKRALAEVARIFLADAPKRTREIRRAIANGDARALRGAAHTLKGAVSNFGADAAVEAAFELQKLGDRGEVARAPAALERLEAELKALRRELRRTLLSKPKRARPAKRARKPAASAGRKRRKG